MTTLDIELAVARYFNPRTNIIIPNVSWGFGIHECYLLICTKAGYLYEVEIKTSYADLINDKKKWHNHNSDKIKELYFALPLSLSKHYNLIPERAGILEIDIAQNYYHNQDKYACKKVKNAVINKTSKLTLEEKFKLTRLGTMRIFKLKEQINHLDRLWLFVDKSYVRL